jgi:PadR family transcriptional regulator PadR
MQLRPPSFFALAALIDGPLHGYAIMRRAGEMSDNRVKLTTGTLYSVLDRAQAEGLVSAGEVYTVSGRERRDYTLTPLGHTLLAEEAGKLERAARVVRTHQRAATKGAT